MCRGKTCVYCLILKHRPIPARVLVLPAMRRPLSPEVADALEEIARLLEAPEEEAS